MKWKLKFIKVIQYKCATQKEPQTPKGFFESTQNGPADFFVTAEVCDATMLNRITKAGNKKVIMTNLMMAAQKEKEK